MASHSASSYTTFHPYPRLPSELKMIIIDYYVTTPRVVDIVAYNDHLRFCDDSRIIRERLFTSQQPLALLAVDQETHDIALRLKKCMAICSAHVSFWLQILTVNRHRPAQFRGDRRRLCRAPLDHLQLTKSSKTGDQTFGTEALHR